MNEKIKKPLTIALSALIILVILGLSVALICVCGLNTCGDEVFSLNAYDVSSVTVKTIPPSNEQGEERSVELSSGQTSALINILTASDMTLTIGKKPDSAAYRITLSTVSGKTIVITASGEYLSYDGKTYRTNGAVCNFLGYVVYGAL